jgi:hypothetical protein
MTTSKGAMRRTAVRVGPISVICLMVLWGFAMIVPAALPH